MIDGISVRLDSSDSAGLARWGHATSAAQALLRCDAQTWKTVLETRSGTVRTWGDPLKALAWMSGCEVEGARGKWIGHLSYDLGRFFERIPQRARDDLGLPLFCFSFHDGREAATLKRAEYALGNGGVRSTFDRRAYEAAVARAIEYIAAGDVFQVNLSQRFTVGLSAQPREIYARLTEMAPAAYGALLDYGDHALICNSPELFLRVTPGADGRRKIVSRPIKGTRPRVPGAEFELRDSLKDQAELHMIVDLERNDLGRICEIGWDPLESTCRHASLSIL